ncbi:hypothetical protein [Pelosinus sp. sgz500959]|uniref:hypothetical protein n=1 Tax=Pelosinus sp. sgz500959 TaxID=3242472 RepID=UPI0036710EE0
MEFTKQMYVVMETIWHLRATTRTQKLVHTDIEELSSNFTKDNRPVKRQNWYNSNASPEWKAIKDAIEGKLPSDHIIEQTITAFGKADKKTGMLAAKIFELTNDKEKAKVELTKVQQEFQEFKKRTWQEQYEESHFRVNFEYYKNSSENLQKEKNMDIKLIQNYQIENARLTEENTKLRRSISVVGIVENPKYHLFQPNLRDISADLSDKDLQAAYRQASMESFTKMKDTMKKKPAEDIILIFHYFNINIENFLIRKLSFKFPDNNYVFACCDLTETSRRTRYQEITNMLQLIKPTVFLIIGKMINLEQPSNLVKLPDTKANRDIEDRLRTSVEKLNILEPNCVKEGYENVFIIRG